VARAPERANRSGGGLGDAEVGAVWETPEFAFCGVDRDLHTRVDALKLLCCVGATKDIANHTDVARQEQLHAATAKLVCGLVEHLGGRDVEERNGSGVENDVPEREPARRRWPRTQSELAKNAHSPPGR
jgi:hypothetical protein